MTKRSVTHASFTIERVYPVPPARVFAAFADPALKKRWFGGPPEWGPDTGTMDFRVGGRETSSGGPPGGAVHHMEALYWDIVPDERIVWTYDMKLDDTRISVSLNTVELRAEGKGTRMTFTEAGAYLDDFDKPGVRQEGTEWLLDQLGKSLEAS
jgi:uncharacterized protein YndB with AHSA1/START domain